MKRSTSVPFSCALALETCNLRDILPQRTSFAESKESEESGDVTTPTVLRNEE